MRLGVVPYYGGNADQLASQIRFWTRMLDEAEIREPWLILGGGESLETLEDEERKGRRLLTLRRATRFPNADVTCFMDYEAWIHDVSRGWRPQDRVLMSNYPSWEGARSKSVAEIMLEDWLLRRTHRQGRLFCFGYQHSRRAGYRRDGETQQAALPVAAGAVPMLRGDTEPAGAVVLSILAHAGVRDILMVGFSGTRAPFTGEEMPPAVQQARARQAARDRAMIKALTDKFEDLQVAIR